MYKFTGCEGSVIVAVDKGNGEVGRLIVCGSFPPKLGWNFIGLLIVFVSLIWSCTFCSISSPLKNKHILGKETMGESGIGKFNDLEDVAIIEAISLLIVDVVLADTDGAGAIVVLKGGISNAGGDVNSEEDDVSSIFLSFSIALVNSASLQGACMS